MLAHRPAAKGCREDFLASWNLKSRGKTVILLKKPQKRRFSMLYNLGCNESGILRRSRYDGTATPARQWYLEVVKALPSQLAADGADVHPGVAGVKCAPGFEELVSCNQHRVQHALPQQEVAHPLGDDDVYLLRDVHRLDGALDHLYHLF
jgi:hypothetical protein